MKRRGVNSSSKFALIAALGALGAAACASTANGAANEQAVVAAAQATAEPSAASQDQGAQGQGVEVTAFPRTVTLPGGSFTIYEPQIEDHVGFSEVTAWSAAAYRPNEGEPAYGAVKYRALMVADTEERVVTIYDRDVLEVKFAELDSADLARLGADLRANVRTDPETIPLDVVLGYLADDTVDTASVPVSLEPPTILYATERALLVVLDGEPIKSAIEGAEGLSVVINTNWDLFYSQDDESYVLLLGDTWLEADTLDGPWSVGTAPEGIAALPDTDRWRAVKSAVPGGTIAADELPLILAAQAPAELIVTQGAAELEALPGLNLSFVANTSSDIVFNADDAHFYFLTSGRWFKASALDGAWSSVEALPESFQAIPAGHPRGHVRASVPGTPEAAKAVAEAQVPQTAEVSRETAAPDVTYAGDAQFEAIEGTGVERAINTTFDVFKVAELYYLCHDAVWFVSQSPNGPWTVSDSVPVEIYNIPVDSPAHHVTYVQVYESSPDTIVVGYTPGYHHSYVSNGVVVYGSGYYWGSYYDPYYYTYYPAYYYYPYPYTYGQASIYQVNTGTYVHGHYAYGPYGGYWEGARYNPNTGRYGGGVYAYDYDTAVYEGWSYNPRTDISTNTSQAIQWSDSNSYEAWGETVIQRDDNWVQTERYATEDGFRRQAQTSEGGQAAQVGNYDSRATVGQTADGDLYAGANGNVFRRTEDGEWETRSDGEWSTVDTQGAREEASARANDQGFDRSSLEQNERLSDLQGLDTSSFDRDQFDVQRLERDRAARTNGRSQFESFQSSRGSRGGFSGGRGGRRR